MLFTKNSLVVKSYAKINVSLQILGKRDDGYHLLRMVFLPLELHDVIELERIPNSLDSFITCDDVGLANNHHNLCMKALNAMRDKFHFKEQFNITIHKEIPYAAGLGGGSSNAAVVINTINQLLRLHADEETLKDIGLSIGADVPYFFYNKPAVVTGIGEEITPFALKEKYYCLLVKPKTGLSTKEVYKKADNYSYNHNASETYNVIEALNAGNIELLSQTMNNDLYNPAKEILKDVEIIINRLKSLGLKASMMTGSGSACFALSKDLKALKNAAYILEKEDYEPIITATLIK